MMPFPRSRVTAAALALLGSLALVPAERARADAHEQRYDVELSTHVELGLPEQDAFVEAQEGADQVLRPDVADTDEPDELDRPVYASAEPHEHDPFKLGDAPLGPFEKGEPLGFTLGEWLAGDGTGTYVVRGDEARLSLTMSDLVPGGVYTVWCVNAPMPPVAENAAPPDDAPCGAPDGSENRFTADDGGDASIAIPLAEPLTPTTAERASIVAVAYHSDGATYGAEPGDFGQRTHVQLAWILPADEAEDAAAGAMAEGDENGEEDEGGAKDDGDEASDEDDTASAAAMPETGAGGPWTLSLLALAAGMLLVLGMSGWASERAQGGA